jgi:PAS domain S-box-containing protein
MAAMEGVSSPVEARHRALLDAIPDLMFRISREGIYREFAGDVTRLASPAESLIGNSVYDLVPDDVSTPLMAAAAEALVTGSLARTEYRLRTLDGEERDFEARVVPCAADEVVAIVRDVTEFNRVVEDLRRSRARIVAAGDAASRRIERNLHDGAQQRLVTVSLHLNLIKRRLETNPDAVPALLEAAQQELAAALEEIRELVRGLHPRVLRDHGLDDALRALAERALVPVDLLELPKERLRHAVEACAYYVVAEALANAAKHSAASVVTVRVTREEDLIVVEVADDGVGGADAAGSGLRGLADRVASLEGQLAISSVPGAGTALRAELPAH